MEKDFYTDEFEQLIKEKADQFRMYPSRRVWHSIYNNLHPSRRWPSVIMSLFLLSSLTMIGYLNTGDNRGSFDPQMNIAATSQQTTQPTALKHNETQNYPQAQNTTINYEHAFEDMFNNRPDLAGYTVVRSNRPSYVFGPATLSEEKQDKTAPGNDLVQSVDNYIKGNKIFADVATNNKKKAASSRTKVDNNAKQLSGEVLADSDPASATETAFNEAGNSSDDQNADPSKANVAKKELTNEEKAWMENYVWQNESQKNKWKNKLAWQVYVTPAVNYRKLTTNSKGSTSAFANGDINNSISQKPGFGFESGVGLTYSIGKSLQIKGGVQFNYTNYNISADQTNHPIITTILLNDPATGYSYAAARTSSISNAYNSNALQPVTLHNRTYQISVPIGFAYRLSSEQNVDWFAGATVQPTYVFGGNAHLISSDLKSYVSDPSSISTWNLNLGFETFMNFRLKSFNFQVGPQVRYQVFSTYRKNVALIEKPYAVGLKLGVVKGF
jgi:Outer membrane protein beta-barrel domain